MHRKEMIDLKFLFHNFFEVITSGYSAHFLILSMLLEKQPLLVAVNIYIHLTCIFTALLKVTYKCQSKIQDPVLSY
jgi:hypothetical protein